MKNLSEATINEFIRQTGASPQYAREVLGSFRTWRAAVHEAVRTLPDQPPLAHNLRDALVIAREYVATAVSEYEQEQAHADLRFIDETLAFYPAAGRR